MPVNLFAKPKDEKEYSLMEKTLDSLVDEVRDDKNHPLAVVMQIIGENPEEYDDNHHEPIGVGVSHIDMVKHLMSSHGLYQKDLASIFGSQAKQEIKAKLKD